MRVLLIEDDPSLGTFYSRALKRSGHEVATEVRGDDGLDTALQSAPDVVVLDWFLPGLSGISILKQLRASGYQNPILMLSGSGDEARHEALEAGANAFLAKPCGLADLTNCVAMLVHRSLARSLSAPAA